MHSPHGEIDTNSKGNQEFLIHFPPSLLFHEDFSCRDETVYDRPCLGKQPVIACLFRADGPFLLKLIVPFPLFSCITAHHLDSSAQQ